ncbi:hypothetical protein BN2497_14167 [Janthinobacterium sp. CG23_2]|nr:hypothetical protein BN2497_14167 [Janthinobacterium sp. CG23_2]CUU33481.1 hypothetical protein BN3177_14167 [Janthinobacterium sp. CG23_2]
MGVPKSALTTTPGLINRRKLVEVVPATMMPEQVTRIMLK